MNRSLPARAVRRVVRALGRRRQPSTPFEIYEEVRNAVQRIRSADRERSRGAAAPSAYWAEELGHIDYMAEASPLVIAKLRHHAFQITGIRPYDYRVQDDERRALFEQRLRALEALGGAALVVPEHEAFGGFGYRIDGKLFNLDTLKFLEVLVGLKRTGALDALRRVKSRKVVWEIGGGWGGFAYQFKTLFPDVTYVITDLPELFLFSATYLRTLFPQARTLLVEPAAAAADRQRWREHDFVFVPNTRAAALPGFEPNLAVNIASFQEMTTAQVAEYVAMAARGRCPWFYSLNRERSRYNAELTSVSELIAAHYDLDDVPLLETDYTKATKKPSRAVHKPAAANEPAGGDDLAYRHLAGRLRTAEGRKGAEAIAAAAR